MFATMAQAIQKLAEMDAAEAAISATVTTNAEVAASAAAAVANSIPTPAAPAAKAAAKAAPPSPPPAAAAALPQPPRTAGKSTSEMSNDEMLAKAARRKVETAAGQVVAVEGPGGRIGDDTVDNQQLAARTTD